MRYIYLINKEHTDDYKIGISNKPEKRLKTLQTGNSKKLIIIDKFLSSFATKIETHLHHQFYKTQKVGEWFTLNDNDVKGFKTTCEQLEESFKFLLKENCFFQKDINKLKY